MSYISTIPSKIKLKKIVVLVLMLILGLVFFFKIGESTGYVLEKDSYHYIDGEANLRHGVMPLYTLFVAFFRTIFGEEYYLQIICFAQGVLGLIASIIVSMILRKDYCLDDFSAIIVFVLTFLPYGFSLKEHVITHAILTEGVSISFFAVYIVLLISGLNNSNKVYFLVSFAMSILLLFIRMQMVIVPMYTLLVLMFGGICLKSRKRAICILSLIVGVILLVGGLYIHNNEYAKSRIACSSLGYSMYGKAIYISEKGDIDIFDTLSEKEGFRLVYEEAAKNHALYSEVLGAESSERWELIINGVNYEIKEGISPLKDYFYRNDYSKKSLEISSYNIATKILLRHPMRFVRLCLETLEQSVISSIFFKKKTIYHFCKAITMLLIVASCILKICSRVKLSQEENQKINNIFYCSVGFMIFNLLFLNVFFMSLQRYVIYTMGMFYISNYIMLSKILKMYVKNCKHIEQKMC